MKAQEFVYSWLKLHCRLIFLAPLSVGAMYDLLQKLDFSYLTVKDNGTKLQNCLVTSSVSITIANLDTHVTKQTKRKYARFS